MELELLVILFVFKSYNWMTYFFTSYEIKMLRENKIAYTTGQNCLNFEGFLIFSSARVS